MRQVRIICYLVGSLATGFVHSSCTRNQEQASSKLEDTTIQKEEPKNPKAKDLAVISFQELDHDFGNIKEGEKVTYEYKFSNLGKVPLVVESAHPSCGCTVSAWTKEPVKPGEHGFVRVEFDSKGKLNVQNKTVVVTANTEPQTTLLHFKATVLPSGRKG